MKALYGIICATFCCATMSNAMELVPATLVEASKEWDKAYAEKESQSCFMLCAVGGEYEENIRTCKEAYKKQVKENAVEITWPTFQDWPDLKGLDLSNKGLKTLCCLVMPTYISAHSITELDVSHNHLTDLRLGIIVKKLPNLEKLIASHNEISHMSVIRGFGIPRLKFLDVSHNKLTEFDLTKFISKFQHIKAIDLSHNNISDVLINDIELDSSLIRVDLSEVKINLKGNMISEENIRGIQTCYLEVVEKGMKKELVGFTVFAGLASGVVGGAALKLLFASPYGLCIGIPVGFVACWLHERGNNKKLEEIKKFEHIQFDEEQIS